MTELLLAFVTSFILVLLSTPVLIKVAKLKHLVDEPGDARKVHSRSVPTIGGIMIFAGTIIAYSMWFPSAGESQFGVNYNILSALQEFKFLVASMFILFFLGVKDDIIGVSPTKKLFIHMVVGMILILMANIRITSLHGMFSLYEIPDWASIMFSLFTYIVIVNAINLIDGIDGLAAGVGCIASLTFSFWFFRTGDMPVALLGVGLAGALLGFLVFNFNPAKIFMGDTGSLIIGMVLFVLAVKLVEHDPGKVPIAMKGVSKPVLAMAILCYPLIDTLRVFIYRAVRGRSPFSADKNHIHHQLIRLGLNHKQVSLTLYAYSILIIAITFMVPIHSPNKSLLIVGSIALLLAQSIFFIKPKAKKEKDS